MFNWGVHERKLVKQQHSKQQHSQQSNKEDQGKAGGKGNKDGGQPHFQGLSLLMVCHAKEETHQNMWYLDTGCTNHMSGDKSTFSYSD